MKHIVYPSLAMIFGLYTIRIIVFDPNSLHTRPDYKKLSILRQLFPRVPILALSATCPPKVLKDLVLTLRLKPTVPGTG